MQLHLYTPTTTLYADFSRPLSFLNLPVQQRRSSFISLVALKGAKSQLQQEMTCGGVALRRIYWLGNFLSQKWFKKKKHARPGKL